MSDDAESAEVLALLAQKPNFAPLICCGQQFGVVNTVPFSDAAAARFEEIRQSHISVEDPMGNSWQDDPAAMELMMNPDSYAPLPDGHQFPFACPTCGARFVQAGGKPTRIAPNEIC